MYEKTKCLADQLLIWIVSWAGSLKVNDMMTCLTEKFDLVSTDDNSATLHHVARRIRFHYYWRTESKQILIVFTRVCFPHNWFSLHFTFIWISSFAVTLTEHVIGFIPPKVCQISDEWVFPAVFSCVCTKNIQISISKDIDSWLVIKWFDSSD